MNAQQMSDGVLSEWIDTRLFPDGHAFVPAPYTLSRDSCARMEAELARRGVSRQYAHTLFEMIRTAYAGNDIGIHDGLFQLITATPRQRCEAAYLVLERQP